MSVLRFTVTVLCCVFLAALPLRAQMSAEFYWNVSDRADTVIDFGVTPVGVTVTRSFTVHNTGTVSLSIPITSPLADPFYSIVNVPEIAPEAPPKEEFAAIEALPYSIPPGEERTFGVRFLAVVGNPLLPSDTPTEALLQLRAVDPGNTLGPSIDWTFRLRAMKTTRILATNRPIVRFDSVYVRPQPGPPTERYAIANVTTEVITATVRPLIPLTPVVGTPEITVIPTAETVQFTSQSVLDWVFTYAPRDRGTDSARFVVAFQPSGSVPPDSVVSVIQGVGVEQGIMIASATGAPNTVSVKGDTIDFGEVLADGNGTTATIIVKNAGNMRIGIESESRTGTLRDTNVFVVQRALRDGGASIQEGSYDTLVVRFVPTESGPYEIGYVIATDIYRRPIRGVPDNAKKLGFYLRGLGLRPQVIVTPTTVDFGTVVLVQNCTSSQDRTVTIKNNGNVVLRVDSIGIEPESLTVIPNKTFFNIPIGESTPLTLTFIPSVQGDITGSIRLYTNALPPIVDIPFTSNVVRPDTIQVSLPLDAASRPGHVVRMPFIVQGDRAALTDRVTFTTSYDPELLSYRSVFTEGGGAEGATVKRAEESSPGVLTMELQAPANFMNRDTLLWLVFDTYLGTKARTEVALSDQNVKFGNAGCSSVLNVKSASGSFHLDSLCGISYKTLLDPRFVFSADVVPNPAHEVVSVTIVTPMAGELSVRVFDAFGRLVQVVAQENVANGAHIFQMNVSELHPGIYLVESVQGRRRTTIPMMVGE